VGMGDLANRRGAVRASQGEGSLRLIGVVVVREERRGEKWNVGLVAVVPSSIDWSAVWLGLSGRWVF
jgi:hypothetical protein